MVSLHLIDQFIYIYKTIENKILIIIKDQSKKIESWFLQFYCCSLELIEQKFIHYNDLVPKTDEGKEAENGATSDNESG